MAKTIWVINQFAGKPDSGWGERHYFFAKHWINNGYKVRIISGSFNHLFKNQPSIDNKRFTYEEVEKDLVFCWVKISKYNPESVFKLWSMIVFAFKVLFLSKSKLDKPDVILVSSMPLFSVIPGYILSKKLKAKFLFEVRDLWPQTPIYLKGYSKWHPMILVMSFIEKFGFRTAERIISVLPNSANYINAISKEPAKWCYIPNGIDERTIGHEKLAHHIVRMIPEDKFIVGYTGTIGLANAMDHFIDASIRLKDNRNVHFVLVGDGYLKENYVNKTEGNRNITFIRKISKSKIQDVLTFFDVCYVGRFNSPLYKHGVSYNKYFDYMLAKKPILESSELIKDPVELSECGIIVKPEDTNAIIVGIEKLFNMAPVERQKIGERGYKYVKKHHDIKLLSEKYIDLFRD